MGKYCDPIELEKTWWAWILADRTPQLEPIRQERMLWTKPVGLGVGKLMHRIVSSEPYNFSSSNGIVIPSTLDTAIRASFAPLDLNSIRRAENSNYVGEISIDESWLRLSSMIYKICFGITLHFHPPDDDVRDELAHEALTHTLIKIRRRKLKFTPGLAPPFNLLTTAIFRIMFSIKNKEKRDRDKRSRLADQIIHDAKLPDLNSLNVTRSLIGGRHV